MTIGNRSYGRKASTYDPAHPLKGIESGYLGQVEFYAREGQADGAALTIEQLSDLWLHYESLDNLEACQCITDALAQLERSPQSCEPKNMGLSAVNKSHNPLYKRLPAKRKRRGSNGISANGKRLVRSAIKEMEQTHGIGRLFVGTVTLPGQTVAELETVIQYWSSILKNFKTAIQRHLEAKGCPTEGVYVTEIQPKRYQRTGQVCPHIHFVVVNRDYDGAQWALQRKDLDAIWRTVLSNKLNRPIAVNAACNLEPCRKSAANEMGKYLSKGGDILKQIKLDGKIEQLPKTWLNISQSLKDRVKAKTKTYENKSVEIFFDNLDLIKANGYGDYRYINRQVYDPTSPTNYRTICVGATAYIRDDFIELFKILFESESEMQVFIELLCQNQLKTG